jgi:hypothetical protein
MEERGKNNLNKNIMEDSTEKSMNFTGGGGRGTGKVALLL